MKYVRELQSMGHKIGLHFDEACYPECIGNMDRMAEKIIEESNVLETYIEAPVEVVSMHRHSKWMLDSNLTIPGMINVYDKTFFRQIKYISDSRRNWREPVEYIVRAETYPHLQILTHPFWYRKTESDIHDLVADFIRRAAFDRYEMMRENITDLGHIITENEINAYKSEVGL